MSEGFKVEAADFHRNGVGGEGFMVAIVNDDEYGRMLVIDFNLLDDDGNLADPDNYGYVAVVNLDEAAKGNIYMHPAYGEDGEPVPGTGGNAWRGADRFGHRYREAIDKFEKEQRERAMLRLKNKEKGV